MPLERPLLTAAHVRLEPLERSHVDPLLAATSEDATLYHWSLVPRTRPEVATYIETALSWHASGTAVPFAIVRTADNTVVGSTRFWNLERWHWPPNHPQHGIRPFDACEIGHTWLARSAIRTAINTEAKLLMLTYAFETWQVLRVCLHTDARNQRSRAAIARIGAAFEGILRSHRMAADFTPRDSARFSILAAEWPAVKQSLQHRLEKA